MIFIKKVCPDLQSYMMMQKAWRINRFQLYCTSVSCVLQINSNQGKNYNFGAKFAAAPENARKREKENLRFS